MDWREILGYTGSVLIAVSLMMKDVVRLRYYNMAGAAAFALYGLLISAWPVFLLNAFNAAINLYHVVALARSARRPDA
jgi:hypothetical protein